MFLENDNILEICNDTRENNGGVVFTNGCFDLFHPGHVSLLNFAAKCKIKLSLEKNLSYLQIILIVAINDDKSVSELKGANRPIYTFDDRALFVNSIKCVDYVTKLENVSVYPLIELIKPELLVKGYTTEKIIGKEYVESYGGLVLKSEKTNDYSTTNLIKKLMEK